MCLRKNLEEVSGACGGERRSVARSKGGDGGGGGVVKNSDKRKEQSRNAARNRRGKESNFFTELASVLPLPAQTLSQLDKASVMRLTIANLQLRAVCETGLTKRLKESSGTSEIDKELEEHHLKALDGFLLVVSLADGKVIYTSENIANFLGHHQEVVMGSSLYDYTSMGDHSEVKQLISFSNPNHPRRAFLRLKCTLTSSGRSVNFKNAKDKVVQIVGEVVGEKTDKGWLVALAIPVPHPSNIEFPLDKQTFVSRHSLDMKFTYVDNNVKDFCGYSSEELIGRSMYELHHALDTMLIQDAYKNLLNKGQIETSRYRFLARGGGYVWLVTQATLIPGPRETKPQCVVCLNYVVSEIQCRGEILSEIQLMCGGANNNNNNNNNNSKEEKEIPKTPCKATIKTTTTTSPSPVLPGLPTPPYTPPAPLHPAQPHKIVESAPPPAAAADTSSSNTTSSSSSSSSSTLLPPPPPVASTSKIFVPRSKDVNKGFLTFNNNDPLSTVLKDEPEDLTHLAPSFGDTCVPLPTLLPGLEDEEDEEEDACMPQDVFMPALDDMITLDYPVSVVNADTLLGSRTPDKIDNQDLSSKYFFEDDNLLHPEPVGKCVNSLSGGGIIVNRSHCDLLPHPADSSETDGSGGAALQSHTPEPPKPLLSQAAIPPLKDHSPIPFGSSNPRTSTKSIFMPLDGSSSPSSSDLFGKLDLKFEGHCNSMDSDDFEMRAPYIPPSNDLLLLLDADDTFCGVDPEIAISPKYFRDIKSSFSTDKEDSSLAQLLQDTDPNIAGTSPGRHIHLDHQHSATHRNQYQHSKFLDGGGNFVDPNKVLPGYFAGKDDLDLLASDTQLLDPPPVLVQEPVEPPPPLLTTTTTTTNTTRPPQQPPPRHHHVSEQVKRGASSSPTLHHKKLCSPKYIEAQSKYETTQEHQEGGLRLLTPHAPTMQQLLISKDPLLVRGARAGGGGGTSSSRSSSSSHSVLRNLLVSGRDDSAGYSVSASPSPTTTTAATTPTAAATPSSSYSTHPLKEEVVKGVKHTNEIEGGLLKDILQIQAAGGGGNGSGISAAPTPTQTPIRIPKERMTTMLLTSGDGRTAGFTLPYPTFRLVTGSSSSLKQALKLTTNPNVGQRQDPYLLMSSSTIPTLLELTQQDYEVNAPANNSLQGAELLMALDQTTTEGGLFDGK